MCLVNSIFETNSVNSLSWFKMINRIQTVFGFSLARIAYRIGSSPSSVQKLLKDTTRIPRNKLFFNLACYYYKLFYADQNVVKTQNFFEENKQQTLKQVMHELYERGLLEQFRTVFEKSLPTVNPLVQQNCIKECMLMPRIRSQMVS